MPFVRDNPQWMMLELLDGFGSHEWVLEAHELRANLLVLSAKEESNNSHANQGYDQFFAKEENRKAAETLYTHRMLTQCINNKGGWFERWSFLHRNHPCEKTTIQMFIYSYYRLNINPLTRVSFHIWCREFIAQYLQVGEAFYPEAVHPSAEEMYCLLPEFWHGITPDQKK